MSPFFVPFKNGFNAGLRRDLHMTSRRSKVSLIKIVTLTVLVKDPLHRAALVPGPMASVILHSSHIADLLQCEHFLVPLSYFYLS